MPFGHKLKVLKLSVEITNLIIPDVIGEKQSSNKCCSTFIYNAKLCKGLDIKMCLANWISFMTFESENHISAQWGVD